MQQSDTLICTVVVPSEINGRTRALPGLATSTVCSALGSQASHTKGSSVNDHTFSLPASKNGVVQLKEAYLGEAVPLP